MEMQHGMKVGDVLLRHRAEFTETWTVERVLADALLCSAGAKLARSGLAPRYAEVPLDLVRPEGPYVPAVKR